MIDVRVVHCARFFFHFYRIFATADVDKASHSWACVCARVSV